MNMKNYVKKTASIAALLIVGLLVITGCQGIFEPPSDSPAGDGTGTLLVSFNDPAPRTILPAAKLDKFELNITGGNAFDEDYELTSGTGIVLNAGTYDLSVKGYIKKGDDFLLVAKGSESNVTVAANATVPISIALQPQESAGDPEFGDDGFFAWDFDGIEYEEDGLSIEIYEFGQSTDLLAPYLAALNPAQDFYKVGEITLEAGVYEVAFSVETSENVYAWRETLYIYVGLTSKYGSNDFLTSEVGIDYPYVVPADDAYGVFYLDLNDWKTLSALSTVPVAGKLIQGNKLEATMTANGQVLSIGLTPAQIQMLRLSKGPIKITIEGESITGSSNFRYFIGTPVTSGSWNATGGSGERAFSNFLGGANATTQGFNDNKESTSDNGDRLSHLILQLRAAATNTIQISSIKIEYPLGDDGFDLELDKPNQDEDGNALTISGSGTLAGTVSSSNGVITGTFSNNSERIAIPLTSAQIGLLVGTGITADPGAADVFITIWGSATQDNAQIRYHLGNVAAANSWNATATAHAGRPSTLIGANGISKRLTWQGGNLAGASVLEHFILQRNDNGDAGLTNATTVTIERIRIDYTKNTIAPSCECVGCAVNGKTKVQAKEEWLFPTCTGSTLDDCPVCSAIGAIPFDITTITGLPLTAGGNPGFTVISDSGTLATVTANSGTYFYAEFPTAITDPTVALTITYAAIIYPGEIGKTSFKKGASFDTINNGGGPNYYGYGEFTTTQSGTITLPAGSFDANSTGVSFQHNWGDTTTAKYQVKIISIVPTP